MQKVPYHVSTFCRTHNLSRFGRLEIKKVPNAASLCGYQCSDRGPLEMDKTVNPNYPWGKPRFRVKSKMAAIKQVIYVNFQ